MNPSNSREKITNILLYPFNLIAALIDLLFCIPILGRVLKWVWNSIITFLHFLVGLVEYLLWQIGFRPDKKFRIGFLILTDEEGNPLLDGDKVLPAVEKANRIYAQAHIELIPAYPTPKKLSEDGEAPKSGRWVRTLSRPTTRHILEVDCNLKAMLQDFGLPGMHFQYNTLTSAFESGLRRITGFGAPVTVMIVKEIRGFAGCSLGWLSDYVTVEHNHIFTTAHELGHACNLFHRTDEANLMHPRSGLQEVIVLTNWQIAMMRASRHVTFF
jgi:hypothetical protein